MAITRQSRGGKTQRTNGKEREKQFHGFLFLRLDHPHSVRQTDGLETPHLYSRNFFDLTPSPSPANIRHAAHNPPLFLIPHSSFPNPSPSNPNTPNAVQEVVVMPSRVNFWFIREVGAEPSESGSGQTRSRVCQNV
ncbi:MAG: hypothetical protein KDK99_19510, partial [Verrucomicrobiales bacterium]|nr:hypothetical protein [Verrucomicrobiales bacterium]